MASRSEGVQQLLAAEKAAAEKVNEARRRKVRRLKQAKDEAQQEVEAYRTEREKAYRQMEQMAVGNRSDQQAKIDVDTQEKLDEINKYVDKNTEAVIEKLLQLICNIVPELHVNYRAH